MNIKLLTEHHYGLRCYVTPHNSLNTSKSFVCCPAKTNRLASIIWSPWVNRELRMFVESTSIVLVFKTNQYNCIHFDYTNLSSCCPYRLLRKREPVALLYLCCGGLCLFLTMPWIGMPSGIVAFSGHTHLLFIKHKLLCT